MTTLTPAQMAQLESDDTAADQNSADATLRAAYYNDLASFGDPYGILAAGVADGSTLTGLAAEYFLADQAEGLYNVDLSSGMITGISVDLMDEDYAARVDASGNFLTYQQIEDYHRLVFSDPSFSLGLDCWAAYVPLNLLGQTAWDLMINAPLIGSGSVWVAMLSYATTPTQDLYSPGSNQTYGQIADDQQAALTWAAQTAYAVLQALNAPGWQPGFAYGSPINYTDPVAPSGQPALLDCSSDGASEIDNGSQAQAGDILVALGGSIPAMATITSGTVAMLQGANNLTINGDSNQIMSFGTDDALSVVGNRNTIYAGEFQTAVNVGGNMNIIRGGEGNSSVELDGNAAAANFVIGGVGTTTVDSTAPATIVIGGPGTVDYNQDGPSCSLIGGTGTLNATMITDGAEIVTGSGVSNISLTGGGGVLVSGSGVTNLTYVGSGGMFYQGDPSGIANFNVSGVGISVAGGSDITMSGTGDMSLPWGPVPSYASIFSISNYTQDPDLAVISSAISASSSPVNLDGSIQQFDSSSPVASRNITFNVDNGSVETGNTPTNVTVNGSNNEVDGGSGGNTIDIARGVSNRVVAGAGNNSYADAVGQSLLDYSQAPSPVTANLTTGVASNGFGGTDSITGFTSLTASGGATLTAGSSNDTLEIDGDGGTLIAGSGVDTLNGYGDSITFQLGQGNAIVNASGANETYLFDEGDSAAGIDQTYTGVSGTLVFAGSISYNDLWLSQDSSGDLLATLLGTDNALTIDDWFPNGGPGQLSAIQTTGDGMNNSQINNLESVMAAYQADNPGFNPNTAGAMPSDGQLQSALAAYWQPLSP